MAHVPTTVNQQELLARALAVTPGASQTRSKAPGNVGPADTSSRFPLFATGGHGAYLLGIDGRRYLDCAGANAAIPLGYAHPEVTDAVLHAVANGSLLSLPHRKEAQVGRRFLEVCAPWAEQVRWVRTGSEATHAALQIARQATGRRVFVRLRGSYHGWHDCWRDSQADARWLSCGTSVYEAGYLFASMPIAALFIEPPRWDTIAGTWLSGLVSKAREYGVVVIFDEMVYGLRWAKGGSVEYYGVEPDLACFGKALGNGVPVACICGREQWMRHAVDAGVSGTYGGDAIGLSAAQAVLDHYAMHDIIGRLWENGRQLQDAFTEAAPAAARLEGTPVHWRLVMATPHLLERAVLAAAERGVLVSKASNNASAAMTKEECRSAGLTIAKAASIALSEEAMAQ